MKFQAARFLGITTLFVSSVAFATDPANYPANANGIPDGQTSPMLKEFNWQKEWGSIHMNSFADGLGDPGDRTSSTGAMECYNITGAKGSASICNPLNVPANGKTANFTQGLHSGDANQLFNRVLPDGTTAVNKLTNGIKYDIKNSLLNCMSKALPNFSYTNSWNSDDNNPPYTPCTTAPGKMFSLKNLNSSGGKYFHDYQGPETVWNGDFAQLSSDAHNDPKSIYYDPANPFGRQFITYAPVYDPRSNDSRALITEGIAGCQQQIANNCAYTDKGDLIRDIHQCVNVVGGKPDEGPGYKHPVSHVFTPQETADLKFSLGLKVTDTIALPTVYWSYGVKDKDGNKRTALSAIDPNDKDNQAKLTDFDKDATIEKIDTSDPSGTSDHFLSNLKSYRFDVPNGDFSTFVVMDPSKFFDLKLYIHGNSVYSAGEFSSAGYDKQVTDQGSSMYDSKGLIQTWNTCPVLGPSFGYGGICDPAPDGFKMPDGSTHQNAGCNLPVYAQGPQTEFTDDQNNKFSYANYPLAWSGYSKKWAMITVDQYLKNICGNSPCGPYNTSEEDREDLYIVDQEEGLNSNPVLMVTRSSDYCEVAEMTSKPRYFYNHGLQVTADMPCIQYLQYQQWEDADGVKQWSFVDLYNPVEAQFNVIPPENDSVHLFHLKSNGDPDYSNPVVGTGDNHFIKGKYTKAGNFVRLLDVTDPKGGSTGKTYYDPNGNLTANATYVDDKGNPHAAVMQDHVTVTNTSGQPTTGIYLVGHDSKGNVCNPQKGLIPGCVPDTSKGTALPVIPGTASAIRMAQEVVLTGPDGKPKTSSCVILGYLPSPDSSGNIPKRQVFVPTNSQAEFQAFVSSMQAATSPVEGATLYDCSAAYQHKMETRQQLAFEGKKDQNNFTDAWTNPATNKTTKFVTWAGTMQCSDVAKRPACNQVRMISAQRRCQLENGANGRASDCAKAPDPDALQGAANLAKWDFNDDQVGGAVLVDPSKDSNGPMYFSASCFAESSEGCPAAGIPGGHVFCLSPETPIAMADGTEKPIKDVKAGDEVVAFSARQSRSGAMGKAVVKATAITKKQDIVQINGLKITPLHKVVLANGRAVAAKEIKVGDKLLKGNGQVEVVTKAKALKKKITVYNLVLEKESDGYIAGGIRVMSYPLMPEMEIISGHASGKKPRRWDAAGRSVSSLKRAK